MAKKRKMYSQFNYVPGRNYEKDFGESKTIPGEALDIVTILQRSQQGIVPKSIEGVFSGIDDFDFPDLEKLNGMDIEEQTQTLRDARNRVDELRDTLERKKSEVIDENKREKAKRKKERIEKEKENEGEFLENVKPVDDEKTSETSNEE